MSLDANATVTTVNWVAGPTGRGTFSLIFSCLLTLGLCVWSAMHLNIPPHHESPFQTLSRNVKWGVTGIFAPELVVFAAWRQYNSAKALQLEVETYEKERKMKAEKDTKYSDSCELEPSWTMVHGFYAGMGGFVFEMNDLVDEAGVQFVPSTQYLTITARGIAFLARCGHLPRILKDDINDKSKADSITKSIVCLQAAWMVVQVIGRVALGLPATLLEVNILGHVLCALVIYILWWHKPRMVHEPTILSGEWVRPLLAYMYMSSRISGQASYHTGVLQRARLRPELASLAFSDNLPTDDVKSGGKDIENTKTILKPTSPDESGVSIQESVTISGGRTSSDASNSPGQFRVRLSPLLPNNDVFQLSDSAEQAQSLHSMQLTRWRLSAEAVQTYSTVRDRFDTKRCVSENDSQESYWLVPTTEELIEKTVTNWPSDGLLRRTGGLVMGMVLWFASMAYGAIHIAAWNEYFPSEAEMWLWRSSAIYITFSGALWMIINLLAHESKRIDAYWDRILALQAGWMSYLFFGTICSICGIAFIFARIFLVVEAFISIRQLPITAYLTPDWTQVIPHL